MAGYFDESLQEALGTAVDKQTFGTINSKIPKTRIILKTQFTLLNFLKMTCLNGWPIKHMHKLNKLNSFNTGSPHPKYEREGQGRRRGGFDDVQSQDFQELVEDVKNAQAKMRELKIPSILESASRNSSALWSFYDADNSAHGCTHTCITVAPSDLDVKHAIEGEGGQRSGVENELALLKLWVWQLSAVLHGCICLHQHSGGQGASRRPSVGLQV
jgi:hypothetical protein